MSVAQRRVNSVQRCLAEAVVGAHRGHAVKALQCLRRGAGRHDVAEAGVGVALAAATLLGQHPRWWWRRQLHTSLGPRCPGSCADVVLVVELVFVVSELLHLRGGVTHRRAALEAEAVDDVQVAVRQQQEAVHSVHAGHASRDVAARMRTEGGWEHASAHEARYLTA